MIKSFIMEHINFLEDNQQKIENIETDVLESELINNISKILETIDFYDYKNVLINLDEKTEELLFKVFLIIISLNLKEKETFKIEKMLNDIKTDNFCKNKTDFIKTLIDIVKSKNNKERLEKIYTLIEHKKITEYINEYIQRIKNYRELKNQYSA